MHRRQYTAVQPQYPIYLYSSFAGIVIAAVVKGSTAIVTTEPFVRTARQGSSALRTSSLHIHLSFFSKFTSTGKEKGLLFAILSVLFPFLDSSGTGKPSRNVYNRLYYGFWLQGGISLHSVSLYCLII
jgi:hypothetical protein